MEDSSPDEKVPEVSELSGEQRKTSSDSGRGEKSTECAEELETLGITVVWDHMGGDGEDATATLLAVRRAGK